MSIRISGTIVSPAGVHPDHLITIDDNTRLITEVGAAHRQRGNISFSGEDYLIFPGFADVLVQGGEKLEVLEEAAVNGGVVAMALVPENPDPITQEEHVQIEESFSKSDLSIIPYYRIAQGSEPVLLHRRDPVLLNQQTHMVPHLGIDTPYIGSFTSEDAAEETLMHFHGSSVTLSCWDPLFPFYVKLQHRYGFTLVAADVTPAGLELVNANRNHGEDDEQGILCETTFKTCAPVIEGIRREEVNFITTEHWRGSIGLESFGEMAMQLEKKHGLKPEEICRIACLAPGAWISQYILDGPTKGKGYGRIEPKYIASFAVVNRHTRKVEHTIVRGQVMK